ncbi:glycine zipper family protein [Wolbachia endosymbiont (group B) of Athalia cordata]|uniref:glycine zipper family protein n=1 Tax=Wolbachia endosymbiont (group B) of Athalia cordata TaxID=2953986 RepID=UPI002230D365|nr:glycine zipper family protein [Wolbachia endosymbiont (group B) of Athalia cordata]
MVQGGAANSAIYEKLIESVVQYISGKKDLLQALETLLQANGFIKEGEISNESTIKNMSKFLIERKDVFGDVIGLILEDFEKNKVESKEFLEQVSKVKGMEKELETLGNQLLAQEVISVAAFTTLTGALAGLLTVGGVTGALIVGGAAFVGFMALVAIAAIGYAIYQDRSEIKEGAMKAGKAVKSFVKDVIDKLPTIQARENNFDRLRSELLVAIADNTKLKAGQSIEDANNQNKIVEMLRNQEQLAAIGKLIGGNKADLLSNLMSKGTSTHEEDMEKLVGFMSEFQPAIMAIGDNDIEKVREKVNEKVKEMKPSSKVKESNSEQVDGNNIAK